MSLLEKIKEFNKDRLYIKRKDSNPKYLSILDELTLESIKDGKIINQKNNFTPKNRNLCGYTTYCGPSKNLSLKTDVRDEDFDFFIVSNNEDVLRKMEHLGWNPIFINTPVVPDILVSSTQAKIAKSIPHIFSEINSYNSSYYFDDKLSHIAPYIGNFLNKVKSKDKALYVPAWPDKGNILDVICISMKQRRYLSQYQKISKFIIKMNNMGYSLEDIRLFGTNNIFRNQTNNLTKSINEEWYSYINECGIQCQVSFDMLAQKYNYEISSDEISNFLNNPI